MKLRVKYLNAYLLSLFIFGLFSSCKKDSTITPSVFSKITIRSSVEEVWGKFDFISAYGFIVKEKGSFRFWGATSNMPPTRQIDIYALVTGVGIYTFGDLNSNCYAKYTSYQPYFQPNSTSTDNFFGTYTTSRSISGELNVTKFDTLSGVISGDFYFNAVGIVYPLAGPPNVINDTVRVVNGSF